MSLEIAMLSGLIFAEKTSVDLVSFFNLIFLNLLNYDY